MMRHFIFALTLSLLLSVPSSAQNNAERPLITVSGQAEVNVVPDEVVFNLRVVTLDKDLLKAQAMNDESVKKTLALARSYQIPPERMQTSHIEISKSYSNDDDNRKPSEFLGYQVTRRWSSTCGT